MRLAVEGGEHGHGGHPGRGEDQRGLAGGLRRRPHPRRRELGQHRGPAGVVVGAGEVEAAQARARARQHQRPDLGAGAAQHDRQVRDAAPHPGQRAVGVERPGARQDHEVRPDSPGGLLPGIRSAHHVPHAGLAQHLRQRGGQRAGPHHEHAALRAAPEHGIPVVVAAVGAGQGLGVGAQGGAQRPGQAGEVEPVRG